MAKKKKEEPVVKGDLLGVVPDVVESDKKDVKCRKDSSVELSRLRDLNASLQDQLSKLTCENERLSDELSTSSTECSSLAKELKKLKQDYKKCQVDSKANSDLVESLHNELVRKETMLSELKGSVSELQKNLSSGKEFIAQQDKHITELEKQVGVLSEDIAVRDTILDAYDGMGFWKRFVFLFTGKCRK